MTLRHHLVTFECVNSPDVYEVRGNTIQSQCESVQIISNWSAKKAIDDLVYIFGTACIQQDRQFSRDLSR